MTARSMSVRSATACRPIPPTGVFTREGAEVAHQVLRAFDPAVGRAAIDLARTYTDAFVENAVR